MTNEILKSKLEDILYLLEYNNTDIMQSIDNYYRHIDITHFDILFQSNYIRINKYSISHIILLKDGQISFEYKHLCNYYGLSADNLQNQWNNALDEIINELQRRKLLYS